MKFLLRDVKTLTFTYEYIGNRLNRARRGTSDFARNNRGSLFPRFAFIFRNLKIKYALHYCKESKLHGITKLH